ncbi:lecithin retinol acyltransferase family protein [Cupriavidus sp. CV2]|uniref:lecithin retinol acyltransferase family protein n=1 Tax=Cupriavidus ulmosensis TaxID=3065913 RepID=UPI00296AA012|nr:lecithin retinol acyltransferase family protein [Cupriavidus sp. CV2]MDW3681116.1 lecithin retinol acyltransferase family protein [Cupriavidus sp. CV2]
MERSGEGRQEPPLGAHLVTPRRGYSHHGIYVGNGRVMHYAGLSRGWLRGPVEELGMALFAAGHVIEVKAVPLTPAVGEEAVSRARSRLGENRYRLLTNNCEHFCAWCLYGESRSEQVQGYLEHPWRALRLLGGFVAMWWRNAQVAGRQAMLSPGWRTPIAAWTGHR